MPNDKSIRSKREWTKDISVTEGMLSSAMTGVGTYFITPFALLLGASPFMIGLLNSFSTLSGTIGDYLGAWALQFEGRRAALMSKFAELQAFFWLLMAVIPLIPFNHVILLVIIYSLVSLAGALTAPAWTSLMNDVVKKKDRGVYFGARNKIGGFVELATSLITGIFLSWVTGSILIGFGITFVLAFVFRFISGRLLSKHWDSDFKPKRESLSSVVKVPNDPYLRNLVYLNAGMLFATGIAGPFFAVFMLSNLHFSYFDFAIATAASTFATLISQPYWGTVIDKYGTRPVMFSTALLIPFIALLWIPANNFTFVVLVQLFSGVVWSGFNLATFNMMLKIAPRSSLHDYAAHINGLGALTTFGGGILGSLIVLLLGSTTLGILTGLQIIFLISGLARFVVAAITVPRITKNMTVDGPRFLMRVVTVYPIKGVKAEVLEMQHLISSITNRFG